MSSVDISLPNENDPYSLITTQPSSNPLTSPAHSTPLPAASARSLRNASSFALSARKLSYDNADSKPAATPGSVITIVKEDPAGKDSDAILRPSSSVLHHTVKPRHAKSLYVRISEILLLLTYAGVVVLGALMVWYLVARESELHVLSWGIAGIFTALTIPLSVHEIQLHCKYYVSPLQRHYVRIIAMPIIYAFESWLAIRYTHQRAYLETLRDLYEAYVIWSFYHLMLQFLGGKKRLAARLVAGGKERVKHLPPCCCLRGWKTGSRFIHRNTVGIYQYVILRVIISLIMCATEAAGLYAEGNWAPDRFYLWATIIINVSQAYALYCLALFYTETRKPLQPLKPLGKFAVVKAVIFFSWWQAMGISVLCSLHVIKPMLGYDAEELGKGLQNFLICIEMFIAAIAHRFYYSITDFHAAQGGVARDTPLAAMQRAEAEFVKAEAAQKNVHTRSNHTAATASTPTTKDGGADSVGVAADDGAGELMQGASGHAVHPSGFINAFVDVLPGDIIMETRDHFRTGFGLLHKWEKRKVQRQQHDELVQKWVDSDVGSRTRPRSKFASDSLNGENKGPDDKDDRETEHVDEEAQEASAVTTAGAGNAITDWASGTNSNSETTAAEHQQSTIYNERWT